MKNLTDDWIILITATTPQFPAMRSDANSPAYTVLSSRILRNPEAANPPRMHSPPAFNNRLPTLANRLPTLTTDFQLIRACALPVCSCKPLAHPGCLYDFLAAITPRLPPCDRYLSFQLKSPRRDKHLLLLLRGCGMSMRFLLELSLLLYLLPLQQELVSMSF